MIISYLITALVVFSLIGSVVYAMWKCAKRIAFILSIFLFIILVAVVVKVFFNKENVEKLHANISASGIDQIAENAAAKSVDAVKSSWSQQGENAPAVKPVPAETAPAPVADATPAKAVPAVKPSPAETAPAPVADATPAKAVPAVKPAPAAATVPAPAQVVKAAPAVNPSEKVEKKPAGKLEDNLIDLL